MQYNIHRHRDLKKCPIKRFSWLGSRSHAYFSERKVRDNSNRIAIKLNKVFLRHELTTKSRIKVRSRPAVIESALICSASDLPAALCSVADCLCDADVMFPLPRASRVI